MMRVFGINVFLLFLQELCNSKDESGVTKGKCVKVPLEVVYKSERLLTGEVTDKNWFFLCTFLRTKISFGSTYSGEQGQNQEGRVKITLLTTHLTSNSYSLRVCPAT